MFLQSLCSWLQEGLALFNVLEFLSHNPSEENLLRVFPSIEETNITPQLFLAAVRMREHTADSHAVWTFFKKFLEDLHSHQSGMTYNGFYL